MDFIITDDTGGQDIFNADINWRRFIFLLLLLFISMTILNTKPQEICIICPKRGSGHRNWHLPPGVRAVPPVSQGQAAVKHVSVLEDGDMC